MIKFSIKKWRSTIYYYKVALLKSSAPILTYSYKSKIEVGKVVKVPLKSKVKRGVIVEETTKPIDFETVDILEIEDKFYTKEQIEISEFISKYYFCSVGEALNLYIPHNNSVETKSVELEEINSPNLSKAQQIAFNNLLKKDLALLFGVTGAGKTEIFISLIIKNLKEKKRTILLMPEISLTPQMEKRLKRYFNDKIAIWHSRLTKKQKQNILDRLNRGEIYIIAGARSALFTPIKDVGLIIVDEEHDDSYKSMMKPRYHARDMAIYIGRKIGAKVVLSSATPTLSSYYKYDIVRLKEPFIKTKKRYIFIEGNGISNLILEKIEYNFKKGEQSLLFIPTRGNFKYLYCPSCGETQKCPNCSVGMALHAKYRQIKCHYCNHTQPIPEICNSCGYSPLTTKRIGTAEAKEIIEKNIEGIVVEQFDKDTITTPTKLKKALERFEQKKSHILLGTQMLSKGHDYANITLSVILGIDYILGISDYRAREKAMSLLVQIAGRSGRAKSADIIVQSANGDFFEMYIEDYEEFLKDELEFARDLYPPFVTLARVLISNRSEKRAFNTTKEIVSKLEEFKEIEIVGHGKAPIEKIANKYRYQILLRSSKRVPMLKALHQINNPQIEIDIDPVEFH